MTVPSIEPIPPYKALIFDCDGTLADTLPVHFQTWLLSLQAVGATLDEAQDCIIYEDSDGGLEAARRAGMRSRMCERFGIFRE